MCVGRGGRSICHLGGPYGCRFQPNLVQNVLFLFVQNLKYKMVISAKMWSINGIARFNL